MAARSQREPGRRGRDAGSGRSACSDHVSGLGFARATPSSQASHADAPVSATQRPTPTRPRESEAARAPTSPDQAQAGSSTARTHGRAGLVRACARLRRSCFPALDQGKAGDLMTDVVQQTTTGRITLFGVLEATGDQVLVLPRLLDYNQHTNS